MNPYSPSVAEDNCQTEAAVGRSTHPGYLVGFGLCLLLGVLLVAFAAFWSYRIRVNSANIQIEWYQLPLLLLSITPLCLFSAVAAFCAASKCLRHSFRGALVAGVISLLTVLAVLVLFVTY